jgi:hypothetical protein
VIGVDGTEVRLVVVALGPTSPDGREGTGAVVLVVPPGPLLDATSWTAIVEPARFPASAKVLPVAGTVVQTAPTQLCQVVTTDWAPSQVPGVSVSVWPATAVPVIEGMAVFTGGPTGSVGADVSVVVEVV